MDGGANAGGGAGPGACEYAGMVYELGESFPATDGCNTCSCGSLGVECTLILCVSCVGIEAQYARDLTAAKACNPELSIEQCTELTDYDLECGCPTFTNPANDRAEALSYAKAEWHDMSCGSQVECDECVTPTRAFCSLEGMCQDSFQ